MRLDQSQVGQALYLVQEGGEPHDFKAVTTVGSGASEIRVRIRTVRIGATRYQCAALK